MTAGGAGHTIGVTVAIPSPFGEQIDSAWTRFNGSPPDMPAHITILAPVDVDADALPAVVAHLSLVAARSAPFRVRLRGTGTFQPVSPVVFLALAEGISSCELLERSVRSGDLGVELRFPYHPHVTVAQGVSEEALQAAFDELAGFSAAMRAESMELHEMVDGGWRRIESFRFGG
jgi:2'-5' RNA ligase